MSISWHVLTRRDLAQFDDISTKVVLYAMERGGEGRISSKGHAIVRAPNGGGTMSVPAHGARSQQILELTVRKMFPDDPPEAEDKTPPPPIPAWMRDKVTEPTLPCPVDTCDAMFVTEGARYSHTETEHVRCRVPGCGAVLKSAVGEGGHYRITHLGARPAKGSRRKKQKPARGSRPAGATTPPDVPVDEDMALTGDAPKSTAGDAYDVMSYLTKERAVLLERIRLLEQEVHDLRAKIAGATEALR